VNLHVGVLKSLLLFFIIFKLLLFFVIFFVRIQRILTGFGFGMANAFKYSAFNVIFVLFGTWGNTFILFLTLSLLLQLFLFVSLISFFAVISFSKIALWLYDPRRCRSCDEGSTTRLALMRAHICIQPLRILLLFSILIGT
jgi:hypothetical protein